MYSSSDASLSAAPAQVMAKMDEQSGYLFLFLEIFAREGGIQSYVKDIFHSYLKLNPQTHANVFLLRDRPTTDNPYQSQHLNFHYFATNHPKIGRLKLTAALLKFVLTQRPKRIFCGHINLAPLVQLICKPLGIPYTVLTYGKEVWSPLADRPQKALQQADEIWTISRYSRDRLCESNQIAPEKVKFLCCAIDDDRFHIAPKSPSLLQKYNLENASVLVTVARLWSGDIYKGVDVTIRALPAIAQVIPDVKYLVIGRGDDQPRLAKLAEELGVSDRVVFAGFVATEDLPNHYRLADVYVMPSQEGFGIVYLEAMACGVPVISGDADGSADPLQDGKVGWKVPHRDVDAVAKACIEVLQNQMAKQQGQTFDQRCDGEWLRTEAIATFGQAAWTERLGVLLGALLG
jgi:glycosyltransferase involved in cell wall biosynthesis